MNDSISGHEVCARARMRARTHAVRARMRVLVRTHAFRL
jgi:hypothetical protein